MINQELLDYIKQEIKQGTNNEQIRRSLLANGWEDSDIDEAFSAINYSAPNKQNSNFSNKRPIPIWKIITSLVGVAIIGIGIYFATQKYFKSEEKPISPDDQIQQVPATPEQEPPAVADVLDYKEERVPTIPRQEPPTVAGILDCKEDMNCLIRASMDCKPAKMVSTEILDFFGVKQTTTKLTEIRKSEEVGKCNLYLRTEKIDVVFPENAPQEEVDQMKEYLKKLEGRDGTCKFDISDLTAMLTRWEKGNFDSGSVSCTLTPDGNICETVGGDFGVAECQGTFFEHTL